VRIVFPGDLTAPAWKRFMLDSDFVSNLHATRIFVASHHGRDDGYCPEIFRSWQPDVVVVSDKRIMHESQIVDYGRHAKGLSFGDGTTKKA
jgi:hypothetical protein